MRLDKLPVGEAIIGFLALALIVTFILGRHEVGNGNEDTSASSSAGASATASGTTASIRVNVREAEFSVTSDPTGVPPGSVEFNVTNTGAAAHEFVVIQTDNPPNALLYDDTVQKAVEDAPGQQDVGEVGGELPFILPGQSDSGSFDLAPGKYVFLCNIPGHYKDGMYTSFTVGPVSTATPAPGATPSAADLANDLATIRTAMQDTIAKAQAGDEQGTHAEGPGDKAMEAIISALRPKDNALADKIETLKLDYDDNPNLTVVAQDAQKLLDLLGQVATALNISS